MKCFHIQIFTLKFLFMIRSTQYLLSFLFILIKETKPKSIISSPISAFLGPKIWKKPIKFHDFEKRDDGEFANNGDIEIPDAECSLMNFNDFLNENNFESPLLAKDIYEEEEPEEVAPNRNMDSLE